MHAIAISETGGPDVLTYVEILVPTPGPGEVSGTVAAVGPNVTVFRVGGRRRRQRRIRRILHRTS